MSKRNRWKPTEWNMWNSQAPYTNAPPKGYWDSFRIQLMRLELIKRAVLKAAKRIEKENPNE